MMWLIPPLIFGVVFTFFVGIYRLTGTEAQIESRLEAVPLPYSAQTKDKSLKRRMAGAVGQTMVRSGMAGRIAIDLARANLKLTVGEYVMFSVGLVAIAFLFGFVVTRNAIPGVALAVIATQAPRLYLNRLQTQRQKAFQAQLADVLSLLVSSLRGGYGLMHAMEMVVQEMPNPSAEEFSRVVRETALGFSMSDALDHLVQRVNSDDLELVVTAVNVQHEVGGNLAETLDTISTTIRERLRIKGEISVMTTQQRMTGMVLSGMPFVLGTIMMFMNPDYMMTIFQPKWIFIPGGALVMMVIGNIVIQRLLAMDF
jgi:tight adherence protein B